MLNKLIIALLSTITFSFLFTCFKYKSLGEDDFLWMFIAVIIYSSAVYLIGGIPLSIGVDNWHLKYKYPSKILSYLAKVGMYSVAGMSVMIILYIFESQSVNQSIFDDILGFSLLLLFGCFASNVFYHVELFFNFILKKHPINTTSKSLLD
ncbi:hypothetical protein [Bacillus sp. AFS017336]|uniref:hypothetical protein n=1 Tax=Bacillus sp. AFS017336 TaxID=2033489 RepID=UPI000BF0ADB7|nr:hypothetical protein [Bacillus sp. AFS017336]PEL14449.1 hypothetical protein CN601_00055 [Bacillus sp. AFS017336]